MTSQERSGDDTGKSSLSRLPDYPVNPFQVSDAVCGECEQPRPRTRSYPVLHMVFFLTGSYARIDHVVKCPSCMRSYLWQRLPLSLLLANLLSPIVLVWWTVLFFRTFSRWPE